LKRKARRRIFLAAARPNNITFLEKLCCFLKNKIMEKSFLLLFSILIIILFALNFNESWNNKNYENLKFKKYTWFWFKIFKIEETKENLIKFYKGLSLFVILIMTISVILLIKN
jgi:hypothetical protein